MAKVRFTAHLVCHRPLPGPAFLAAPVTVLLDDPRDGTLYVALAHGHFGCKLHRSLDRGERWAELKPPAFAASDTADAPSVEMPWALAAREIDEPGVVYAGTLPGALFRSEDQGESRVICQPLWDRPERQRWFCAGFDHGGIHSILVDPCDSRHIVLGVSVGGVWITRSDGQSWELWGGAQLRCGLCAARTSRRSGDAGSASDGHVTFKPGSDLVPASLRHLCHPMMAAGRFARASM
jgi:hypothetical protein